MEKNGTLAKSRELQPEFTNPAKRLRHQDSLRSAFLFFGATMASLAAITLLWRGTSLDRIWSLNPTAYEQLAPLGHSVGILFLLLGLALAAAGGGWFRRVFGDVD